MQDELTRTLTRVKREAETPPTIFTAENRDRFAFIVWLAGITATIAGTLITATIIWTNLRTDVANTKIDISEVKVTATRADTTSKKVEEEQNRRAEPMKFLDVTVRSMNEQRNYGINNDVWYRTQHGYPPMALPTTDPTPHN
jgi:hypothetical protein